MPEEDWLTLMLKIDEVRKAYLEELAKIHQDAVDSGDHETARLAMRARTQAERINKS